MSGTTNPLTHPELAAYEVVLEMVKAGNIQSSKFAADTFTFLLDHFRSEFERIQRENKA